MLCPKCNAENLPDALFCNECGTRMELHCHSCGISNPPGSKFCRRCGCRFSAVGNMSKADSTFLEPPGAKPTDTAEGERKTVTALFADIKGSTELMEDIDPEEARRIVDPALNEIALRGAI
jgi:ribosomal protein L40E